MEQEVFCQKLTFWYRENKRELPWRNTHDPYKIWLSEVILQQTRVLQGLPYYQKFVETYPDVEALAAANQREILRLWQGLGYYTRAKNLHECAIHVTTYMCGKFPETYKELKKLKGIGSYTAAAIASFAFKQPVAVVDGNVQRVLSRIFGITDDISTSQGKKMIEELAERLLPQEHSDEYNQAIMEFGAKQCVPISPDCARCPMNVSCYAYIKRLQKNLPFKTKKIKSKNRFFHYVVIEGEKKIMMRERPAKDIWSSLYDFYLVEASELSDPHQLEDPLIEYLKQQKAKLVEVSGVYKHVLTHQNIFAQFLRVMADEQLTDKLKEQGLQFFSIDEIKHLPKPILINNYLNEKIF